MSFSTSDASGCMLSAVSGRYTNTVGYAYDDGGRKSSESLTIARQTCTTLTSYDDKGQLTGYTYPDGTSVERTYTDRGQLHLLKHAGTTIDTRTYDNCGRMTGSSYNNGVSETRAYGTDNTLTSISYSGAAIGNMTYSWDDNKNKTGETITGTMSGYGFSIPTSGYDDEDRLVTYNRTDGNLDQSWSLSSVGDWDSITTEGTAQARTHGDSHELTAVAGNSVSSDVKGNMTLIPSAARPTSSSLALEWDMDNRMSSADVDNNSTADVTYQFDALGRRVARTANSTTTVYVQSGQQTIADYPSGAASSAPTYRYAYGSYIDEPVLRYQPAGSQSVYFHRNQQYSVTALTNASGAILERYAYSAYGTPTITSASGTALTTSAENNRYTYTGREWDDEISLYHYRARMYDPLLGRFCSKDPIGFEGSQWNLYEYEGGLANVDPTGLSCSLQDCTGKCPRTGHRRFRCVQRCRTIRDAFLDWFDEQIRNGKPNYGNLPSCPCSISCRKPCFNSRGRPTGKIRPSVCLPPGGGWYFPPVQWTYLPWFRPGAVTDMRTTSGPPYVQCTYDASGDLITTGPGIGTVDEGRAPGGGHYPRDVLPVSWIVELEGGTLRGGCWFNMYKRVRPLRNGNKCKRNP